MPFKTMQSTILGRPNRRLTIVSMNKTPASEKRPCSSIYWKLFHSNLESLKLFELSESSFGRMRFNQQAIGNQIWFVVRTSYKQKAAKCTVPFWDRKSGYRSMCFCKYLNIMINIMINILYSNTSGLQSGDSLSLRDSLLSLDQHRWKAFGNVDSDLTVVEQL